VRVDHLGITGGMLCGPEHLANRRTGAVGRITATERPHEAANDLLLWVKHGKMMAPYWNRELILVGRATAP